jgi:hypothetical protein
MRSQSFLNNPANSPLFVAQGATAVNPDLTSLEALNQHHGSSRDALNKSGMAGGIATEA